MTLNTLGLALLRQSVAERAADSHSEEKQNVAQNAQCAFATLQGLPAALFRLREAVQAAV